jgi:uncharacterized delta-60 repeat protein
MTVNLKLLPFTMKWTITSFFSFIVINGLLAQDTAFVTKGFFLTRDPYMLACAQQQPDGGVLVSGSFTHYKSEPTTNLVRLLRNGKRDTSFNKQIGTDGDIRNIAIQKDGKIILQGTFGHYKQQSVTTMLIRIDSNGVLDATFNPYRTIYNYSGVTAMAVQDDGRLLLAGFGVGTSGYDTTGLIRLNTDGTLDTSFKPACKLKAYDFIYALTLQKNGKILVGGTFSSWAGTPATGLVRLNLNGNRDSSFVLQGQGFELGGPTMPPSIRVIRELPDSSLLIGGNFTFYNGSLRASLVKLKHDGSLDPAFLQEPSIPANTNFVVYDIALRNDNKILLGGHFYTWNNRYSDLIVLQQNGHADSISALSGPDPSQPFTAAGISRIFVNPDNSFLAFGSFTGVYAGKYQNNLTLYNAQHQLDSAFVNEFQRRGRIFQTLPQADNSILVAGDFNSYGLEKDLPRQSLAKLKKDGSLDTSFVNTLLNGHVFDISQQLDSAIVAVGSFTHVGSVQRNGVARFKKDGTFDASFNFGTGPDWNNMYCARCYKDQYVYIGGSFTLFNGTPHKGIVRLLPNGGVDNSFNSSATPVMAPMSIDVSSNGKVLAAESSDKTNRDYTTALRLYRLMEDGELDSSFQTPKLGWSMGKKVREGKNGHIYWLGQIFQQSNPGNFVQTILCLGQNGSLDSSARRLPTNYIINDFSILPDSNLVICGRIHTGMDTTDFLMRLKPDLSIDSSFMPVALYYDLKNINYTPGGNIIIAVESIPGFRAGNGQIQNIALLRNSSMQIRSGGIAVKNLVDSVSMQQAVDLGTSSVQNFTANNPSALDLSLLDPNKVLVTGPNASEFSVAVQGSGQVIAKNGSLPFSISFTPKSEGSKFATITIPYSNGIDNKYVFVFSATGTNRVTAVNNVPPEDDSVYLYPNPSAIGKVYVRSKKILNHYSVADVSGHIIRTGQFVSPASEYKEIGLQSLTPGIYFIHLAGKKVDITIKLLLTKR